MRRREKVEVVANGVLNGCKSKSDASPTEDEDSAEESIIHHLDIQLMTTVIDIDFPDIPPPTSLPREEPLPHIFGQSIIVVAACANNKVYIIRCPLRPERTQHPRDEYDAVRIAQIELTNKPYHIAATWTAAEDFVEDGYEFMDPDEFAPRDQPKEYDLLVALSTGEAIGRVVFVRLPLVFSQGACFPSDEQYLHYPVANIAFSPASYPSDRHTQLLIAHPTGHASVYDSLLAPQNRWLASFSTHFETKTINGNGPDVLDRKRLLSAQWVTQGQSILVLLEDGEWGIWDCPSSTSSKSSTTSLVLHGYLSHCLTSLPLSVDTGPKKARGSRNSLAPMTPKTRSEKEESLFVGKDEVETSPRGGLSVLTTVRNICTSCFHHIVLRRCFVIWSLC
jgi:hypothetical protein